MRSLWGTGGSFLIGMQAENYPELPSNYENEQIGILAAAVNKRNCNGAIVLILRKITCHGLLLLF